MSIAMLENKSIICVPGDCLCKVDEQCIGGDGTYSRNGHIFAALAGRVNIITEDPHKIIEVLRPGNDKFKKIPSINSVVTCKVLSINSMFSKVSIHCVEDCVLKQPFRGIIRKEDVRALDKDRIVMQNCFRPSDIVVARVIGMGENNAFLLTTAEIELGVVVALSEENVPMVPVSWNEMVCPKTYIKEQRKVAKVVFDTKVPEKMNE